MIQTLFLVIAVLGLVAALGTVLARNLVHAALYLVAFFFIVACHFVLLDAEFLAAIQVLVYIGAVAVLMMFAIMLTRNVQGDDTTTVPRGWVWPAVGATLALFAALSYGINDHVAWSEAIRRPREAVRPGLNSTPRALAIDDMGRAVGDELLTRYAVAFEAAGLMLTAALVGAVALAYRDPEDESDGRPRPAAVHGLASGPGPNGHADPTAEPEPATTAGAV